MKETKFEEAKTRVDKLITKEVNEAFFRTYHVGIQTTISTYVFLKNTYHNKGVEFFGDFKKEFSQFYGIKRFVKDDFKSRYYKKMDELRGKQEYDVKELTKELIQEGNVQFSFVTKLLNIMNDKKYPIYDGNIAKAFGIYITDDKSKDVKIDDYIAYYTMIGQVYIELLLKHKKKIEDFREVFNYTDDLSDLRIIDIIVWKIGDNLINKRLKIE